MFEQDYGLGYRRVAKSLVIFTSKMRSFFTPAAIELEKQISQRYIQHCNNVIVVNTTCKANKNSDNQKQK